MNVPASGATTFVIHPQLKDTARRTARKDKERTGTGEGERCEKNVRVCRVGRIADTGKGMIGIIKRGVREKEDR